MPFCFGEKSGLVVDSVRSDSAVGGTAAVDSVSVVREEAPPRALRATRRLQERLRTEAYATPALVPASPWIDDDPPDRPSVTVRRRDTGLRLRLAPSGDEHVRWWLVRWYRDGTWETDVVPGQRRTYDLSAADGDAPIEALLVSAVDRVGTVSAPAEPGLPRSR